MSSPMRPPLVLALCVVSLAQGQENAVFLPPPVDTPVLAAPEFVLRSRVAAPHLARLRAAREAGGGALVFNVFDDLILNADIRSVSGYDDRAFTLSGIIPQVLGGNFTIAVVDSSIWADIQLPGEAAVRVRMLPGGTCAIERIDDAAMISCAGAMVPAPDSPDGDAGHARGYERRATCPEPDTRFDVAIFWTPAAQTAAGGVSEILATIYAAVTRANDAYSNSGVATRMRLVYAARTEYTESSSMSTDLERLTDCCDGFMDEVHPRRNAFAADFVHLVTDTGSGIAWLYKPDQPLFAGRAFSVGKWDRIASTWTLAHEVGHNMGCNHELANADPPLGWFPFSLGWTWTGISGTRWGTVLSYAGQRVAHFSNPDISFDGQPTGARDGIGVLIAANAQTLNFTDQASANWRNPVYAEHGYSGVEAGCEYLPWNTLGEALDAVDAGGAVIVKPGSGAETGRFTKACTIRAIGGAATIGR